MMLKDDVPSKETARRKAARKWHNNEVAKNLKAEKQRPQVALPEKELEVADTITTDRKSGRVTRFENKFKQEIRAMLDGHAERNLQFYLAALEVRKVKLLKEKLRRLKLAEAQEQRPRDLFGG